MTNLILALIAIESGGNNQAIGDHQLAVGCLQIRREVIEDVNRIYSTRYSRFDCFDRLASINICRLYLYHYGSKLPAPASVEDLARIWNGGPTGWKKPSTKPYWAKVQQILTCVSADARKSSKRPRQSQSRKLKSAATSRSALATTR